MNNKYIPYKVKDISLVIGKKEINLAQAEMQD